MKIEPYIQARREALREVHALEARRVNPYLDVLEDTLPEINHMTQVSLGMLSIDIGQIAGTVTTGRMSAFSRSFLPLLEVDTEFGTKWALLYEAVERDGLRDPIKVYEYYNRYYVLEGNKRVSVMRFLGAVNIEAEVTRIMPAQEDSQRYRAYQAFLRFFADTRIDNLCFTSEQGYERFAHLCGKPLGTVWDRDEITGMSASYKMFVEAYQREARGELPMSASDAFLLFTTVNGYAETLAMTSTELQNGIRGMWQEFVVAAANKPAALLDRPAERRPSVLQTVLRTGPKQVRCAFLYNRTPDESGWTYWHELARKGLETTFGDRVETTFRSNVTEENDDQVIEELLDEGWDVIFATSPVFINACIRASVAHPKAKILNCSLLASYYHVRSFYLRIYEAKFVLGAMAGAMAENDLIGYIADYPICGTPASVNAFALGAQMTNPRARVLLDWSTLPGHEPEQALAAQHASIISSRDIGAPCLESRAFGLYRSEGGVITNLGMPVWNWCKLYQDVVRSILSDAWTGEGQQNTDRAMSYYMGMNAGAIDIISSNRLPAGLAHLCELLKAQIAEGTLHPFSEPVIDQAGVERVPRGTVPTQAEIIRMDYLVSNVIGRIPDTAELSAPAQRLVALQGIGIPEF